MPFLVKIPYPGPADSCLGGEVGGSGSFRVDGDQGSGAAAGMPWLFRWRSFIAACILAALCGPLSARSDSIVVFNEVQYHPLGNEATQEWIELYNQNSVDVDLSGWRLADGVEYLFPEGTVIKGGGYLLIAGSPTTMASLGLEGVRGPFAGRLANEGERVRLRDNQGRVMDELSYGVDGDWPVGPEGGGPSLAKRHVNLATSRPENWTSSAEAGGTPGAANFAIGPILGARRELLSASALWRYQDGGVDPGTGWQAPGYQDAHWSSGGALFYLGDIDLPGARGTALASGRSAYYFRSSFLVDGDPAGQVVSLQPLLNDGAILSLNGEELSRFNLPTGVVGHASRALAAVTNNAYLSPITVPSSLLRSGLNSLAVEVHPTFARSNSGFRLTVPAGFVAQWDGGDGDYSTPESPATAPTNDALSSLGAQVFTTSNPGLATNLIDGRYGAANVWSPAAGDSSPGVIVRFNQTLPIRSIAWSRDNGDTTEATCAGGVCTNRSLGSYTVQYTLAPDPSILQQAGSNPSTSWVSVATVQYLSVQSGFTPHLRHRFEVSGAGGVPLLATGLRLRVPSASTLDEIEINTPPGRELDAAFGAIVRTRPILDPAPRLSLNEIEGAGIPGFWVEIRNSGDTPATLQGVSVVGSVAGGRQGLLVSAQVLPPGGLAVVTFPTTIPTVIDDRVFLYAADGLTLLDSVSVKERGRARHPEGVGAWCTPTRATPGNVNEVSLRRDVVINEIQYHAPPIDPAPGVVSNFTLVALSGEWRYRDAGPDPDPGWHSLDYDASAWPLGKGLLQRNAGPLPFLSQTVLAGDVNTYYFRTEFQFNGAPGATDLLLGTLVDDGAICYLNGTEIYRFNMPPGPVASTTPAMSPVGVAALGQPIVVPSSLLVRGRNVLAVEVHQASASASSSGLVLSGGGLTLVEEGPFGGVVPSNLARQPGSSPFAVDTLSGFSAHTLAHLNDGLYGNPNSWIGQSGNPGYAGIRFGGMFSVSNVAFGRDNLGAVSDRTLGLYTLQYTRVSNPGTVTKVTGDPVSGWANVGTIRYQESGSGFFTVPSLRHRFVFTAVEATAVRLLVPGVGLSVGSCIDELEVNAPETQNDVALGAELTLRTTLIAEKHYQNSGEEWVELHNRSEAPVDLTGWRLDAGIDYRFTNGPILPAGGYWVIARESASLRIKWPELASRITGDFSGRLGDGARCVLRDDRGNVVDETRVTAGGWSDGGGSTLELRDPAADHLASSSWADSDETGKGNWTSVSYRMTARQSYGPTRWNEFRVGLLDDGVVLVDDVSVVRDPDGARKQLIQNGGFDTSTGNTRWRGLGNHRVAFVQDPESSGNTVLQLSASGRAVMNHNHVETTFIGNEALVDGQVYEVRFRARWMAGSPQLSTRAYFGKLAKVTLLPIPARLGTPGSPNSQRVANAGPTFSGLRHSPVVPAANQPVTVSVMASDVDGVAEATLSYRVNPANTFTNLAMTGSSEGVWSATLPPFAAGRIVQFYVTAVDAVGMTSTAPLRGAQSRALFQVADSQKTSLPLHELRLIMLDVDRDFMLATTNVLSNARNGGTLIYDRSEVFYDVGPRLQGTVASRVRDGDDYISYDIGFPPDRLFRGVQNNIGVDRSGRGPSVRGQDEICIQHMFHRAAIPCQYTDLCYFISPRTIHSGTAILQMAGYGPGFISEFSETGGSVFNMDITYEPDTTINGTAEGIKLPVPLQAHIGTDLIDLGDKEQYRSPFDIRSGNRRDDYSGIMRLGRTLGLPKSKIESELDAALDVNAVARMTALEILCGVADTYVSSSGSLPHNLRLFTPFGGGPALFLPWDMDFAFTGGFVNSSVFPHDGINLSKIVGTPSRRRLYLHHVHDLCQTVFNTDYMNPWLAHYGRVVGQPLSGNAAYIASRRAEALSQLPPAAHFAITSNEGRNFEVATNDVMLAGTAWVDVRSIEVNGFPLPLRWVTLSNWEATISLPVVVNEIRLQGVTAAGDRPLRLTDAVTITNTQPVAPPAPVVINEWMASNAAPGGFAGSADGLFKDWFELYNPNAKAVDLGGFFLTDNLASPRKFSIPARTLIAGRGFLLVWADERLELNVPGGLELHANFKLNGGGDEIGLFGPDGVAQQDSVIFTAQLLNISQGLFPDGAVGTRQFMTNWTPRASNRLGVPEAPSVLGYSQSAGALDFTLSSLPGRQYQVEYVEDFGDPIWRVHHPVLTASGEILRITIPLGTDPKRFYRFRRL